MNQETKSSNTNSSTSGNSSAPPAKPDGDNNNPPSGSPPNGVPGGQGDSNQTMQQPPDTPNGTNNNLLYLGLGALSLALSATIMFAIMSKFFHRSIGDTLSNSRKIAIFISASIVIAAGFIALCYFLIPSSGNQTAPEQMSANESNIEATGAIEITDEKELFNQEIATENADESAILVKDDGKLTLSDSKITKSGDSSNTQSSEFSGVNAAILTTKNSTSTIKDTTIATSAKGANAVFATGENAKVYLNNVTITSTGESSARGLDATYSGYIEGTNLNITTQGGSCATLATDRGEGTVKVTKSKLETNGAGSPLIYSTGDISTTDSTGTANGAQIAVIEGKNTATITNSIFTAAATGNRGNTDQAGVMIYQSMSGDATEGEGTFNATDSTLSIDKNSDQYATAPMFFVTNTDAVINLKNTTLNFGSGILLSAKGTDEWGNSGNNGGKVTLNAKSQTLTGAITMDDISSVTINLDENSTWTLTDDSYVAELNNSGKINLNGHTLYVNGEVYNP